MERVDYTEAQQRKIAAEDLPFSRAVVPGTYTSVRTPGGQEIPVGLINMEKAAGDLRGRATDPQYESLRQSIIRRHEATGITPATILNFLPIPLVLNSPMQDLKVRIPPAPMSDQETDRFSFHTWYEPAIEIMERGEKIKQPWDYVPAQIAEAYINEYKDYGGVVLVRGIPDEETLAKPAVRKAIEEAEQKMHAWMIQKVEEANGEWNTANHSGARNIVALHRACATRLKDLGLIDELPEWMVEARNIKEVQKKCPICSSQPSPGAVECVTCHYVLDPAAAYVRGAITEEDGSLERLTRKEVEELGISLYVAETIDEKPARLKTGRPKPMSIAYERAQTQATGVVEPVTGAGSLGGK